MSEMTPYQKAFVEAYERGTEGFEILAIDTDDEGCFSWSPCDTCNQKLGGNRYRATLCNPGPDRDAIEVKVCTDCVMFAANGELPTEAQHA